MVSLNRLPIVERGQGRADIVIRFEDETYSSYDTSIKALCHDLNVGCTNIGKDHVGRVFAEVFGYPLSLDPTRFRGDAVVKSKINATHDGRIIQCPIAMADPALEYQRVVRNERAGQAIDLRTVIVGRQIPVVYEKHRPLDSRFLSANTAVWNRDADEVFTTSERRRILTFCRRIGLDIGELDILRDETNGLIYIVDVNKTAYSHPIELGLGDALDALIRMTWAFRKEYVVQPMAWAAEPIAMRAPANDHQPVQSMISN
jgi:hypothetical protein